MKEGVLRQLVKKRILIPLFAVIAVCTVALIIISGHSSQKESGDKIIIKEVNLKKIDDLMIGAEPPKLLYADKERVIFECGGVYVYDTKNKVILKSFDTSSITGGKHHNKVSCFVTQDGNQIVFGVVKETEGLVLRYACSLEGDSVKELTDEEYKDCRTKAFKCTNIDYNDKLYQKSYGRIAYISKKEYVYLTFKDWKVSTITAVYVNDNTETSYSIFSKN